MAELKISLPKMKGDNESRRQEIAVEALCAGADNGGADMTPDQRDEAVREGIVRATGDYDHEDESAARHFWDCFDEGAKIAEYVSGRMGSVDSGNDSEDASLRVLAVQREIAEALSEFIDEDHAEVVSKHAV